jgi:hypothetical protein
MDGDCCADLLGQMPQVAAIESPGGADGSRALRLPCTRARTMDTAAGNISRAVIEQRRPPVRPGPEQRDLEQVFREAVQAAGGRHAA